MKSFFVITVAILIMANGCTKPKQDIIQPEVYSKQEMDQKLDSLVQTIQQSFDVVTQSVKAFDSASQARARVNAEEFRNYRRIITAIKIPDSVYFCETRIPLEIPDVRERFEKQMYLIMDEPAQIMLYLLRAQQLFPIIEEMLLNNSVPDDLKYIAVIESALKPKARSRAKAQGYWQFIYWTAKKYGVNSTKHVDMRNDLEASTAGAIAYFKKLYKQFGKWPSALAAYNMGETGLAKCIKEQRESDYYNLVLPVQTEAYIFRAAAVKLILEDPGRYDIPPEMINHWESIAKDTLTITIKYRLRVIWVAEWCETTYRQIVLLNPEIKDDMWGPGRYIINIPQGTREKFFNGLAAIKKRRL